MRMDKKGCLWTWKNSKSMQYLDFEIKSDLKTRFVWGMPPSFRCVENMSTRRNFSAMIMSVYTMSGCSGWYPGDTKTIHHPEDTYTFTLLKNIWVGARVIWGQCTTLNVWVIWGQCTTLNVRVIWGQCTTQKLL